MRKLIATLLVGGILLGGAMGQAPSPAPKPQPAPAPVNPPKPAPVVEDVQIGGSSNVPCYGYGRWTATGTLSSAAWICFPDRVTGARVVQTDTFNGGKTFLVAGAPGVYFLAVSAMTPNGMVSKQTEFTVLPSEPQPAPQPVPNPSPVPVPGPSPTPAPVSGKFWAIGIYDASKPLPMSYVDPTIGPTVAALGGTWLKYDLHDPAVASAPWMAAAKGSEALVVVNSDGSVYSAAPLPADAAGIVSAVKTAKGQR